MGISAEERNALAKLTKAERDEIRKRDNRRRMEILRILLGKKEEELNPAKESPANEPAENPKPNTSPFFGTKGENIQDV